MGEQSAPAENTRMVAAPHPQALAPAEVQPHGGMEHRWGRRIPCGSEVRITTGAAQRGQGRMRDVSMSGAYLETSMPLPLHTAVVVSVIRANGSETELRGNVVRRDAAGVGVEWSEASHGAICPVLGCATPCPAAARWE